MSDQILDILKNAYNKEEDNTKLVQESIDGVTKALKKIEFYHLFLNEVTEQMTEPTKLISKVIDKWVYIFCAYLENMNSDFMFYIQLALMNQVKKTFNL